MVDRGALLIGGDVEGHDSRSHHGAPTVMTDDGLRPVYSLLSDRGPTGTDGRVASAGIEVPGEEATVE